MSMFHNNILQNMPKLSGSVGCVWMLFKCWAVGDPQFWIDIHLAADPERAAEVVEIYLANANAPKASDVKRWPASSGEADDSQKRRDEVWACTLSDDDRCDICPMKIDVPMKTDVIYSPLAA